MRWFRWGFFCMIVMILAGCQSSLSPGDAETGIRAMLDHDFEGAQEYVCEDEIENTRSSTDSESFEGLRYDVECQRIGDQMLCEVTFVDPGAQEAMVLELRYEIQDGKLCDRTR